MKKSLLMKTMLLLFALVTGSTCAWAATTETLNIKNYASANNWGNATQYLTATVGDVTFTADGGGNTGKYYSADDSWRFYAGESATLTISVPTGCTLSSVTPTFTVKDSGGLKFGNSACTSGSAVSVSGTSATFTIYSTSGSKGKVFFTSIAVTYSASSKQDAGLSFAIPSYKVPYNTEFTQTVTNPNGLTVTYASSDETIAIVDENSGEVLVGDKAGTVTITASSAETSTYDAGEATYTITVFDANAKGTEKNPYTVTEALAVIDALASGVSTETVFVKGIVSTAPTSLTSGKAKYYISVDGTDADELYVYNGWGLDGAEFADASDIAVGDEVTVKGTLTNYQGTTPEFNKESIITQYKANGSTTEVKATTITTDKYKTYVSTENLLVPAGVTAYIATGETASTLTLTSVEKIKAGTPVILFSETADTYQFEITDEAVTYSAANLLKISDGTAVNGVFVLAKSGDNVGFYKWMGGALSAGRVYVDAPANAARDYLEFTFEESDVTAISEVTNTNRTNNTNVYDLQGRKVAQPTKGLYIVNGRKVIIK
jgi:hypothetical protein